MKNFLLSILISLTLVSTASARNYKVISLGAKAGLNLSSVTGIPDFVGPMKANFTGGLFFEFRPIRVVGISAEVLYTGAGFKFEVGEDIQPIDVSYNFIDIPIMAKIYIAGGLSINAGIQATFMFSPTLNFEEVRSQFDMNKAAFSIPVGLSYTINSIGLTIDARYTFGLTDLLPSEMISTTQGDYTFGGAKNQGIAFTIGWRFLGI